MLPNFNLFGLMIPAPGLILIFAFWLGTVIAERFCSRNAISAATFYNLLFFSLLGGMLGGRLVYVMTYFKFFRADPISVVAINPKMFDIWGILAGIAVTFIIYTQHKQAALFTALDSIAPILAVLALGYDLSNLASGNGYGSPTNLPWGIPLLGAIRHPTQIYEFLGDSLILLWCWQFWKKPVRKPGIDFFTLTAWIAGFRLFTEYFHGDSVLVTGNLRLIQVVAWGILALSFLMIAFLEKQTKTAAQEDGQPNG